MAPRQGVCLEKLRERAPRMLRMRPRRNAAPNRRMHTTAKTPRRFMDLGRRGLFEAHTDELPLADL